MAHRQLKKRFRNRILLYLFLSTFVPLLLWSGVVYTDSLNLHRGLFEKQLELTNQVAFMQTDRWRSGSLSMLNFLIREIGSAPQKQWRQILQNSVLADPGIYASHIIDVNGNSVVRSDGSPAKSYADRRYFQQALKGQISTEPIVSKSYNKPAFCLAGPLFTNGVVSHVVALCSFVDSLSEAIGAIRIGSTGYVVLTDEHGRLLAHPQNVFLGQTRLQEDTAAFAQAQKNLNGRVEFQAAGNDYIAYVSTLANGWKIIALQSQAEITQMARMNLKWIVGLSFLVLIAFSLIVVYLIDRSTAPLHRLSKAVRQLGRGHLHVQAEVESRDEIGLLAFNFNLMAKQIRHTIEELKEKESLLEKHRDELHQKVVDQSQRLLYSAKMSSLGEMAGGIAHEVNNPLAIISLRAQRLQEGLASGSLTTEQAIENAAQIEKTCLRINKIIRGLRAFSRDGSRDPMVAENLSSILAETTDLCAQSLKSRGIELTINCSPALQLECQPVQISQVLLNLLMNARDAVMNLSERWIRIDCSEVDGWIIIKVTDSGLGVSQAIREHMMQPFFTTKGVGEGTGLGLSICKGIVEQHQGRMTYNSDSEHTQFIVALPKAQTRLRPPSRPRAELPAPSL